MYPADPFVSTKTYGNYWKVSRFIPDIWLAPIASTERHPRSVPCGTSDCKVRYEGAVDIADLQ